jgi:hypothetical protein
MDISKTKKYLPIYINFFRNRLDDFEVSYKTDGAIQYLFETVESFIGTEKTNELSFGELLVTYRFVEQYGQRRMKTINKFCEFNEKGLFPGIGHHQTYRFYLISRCLYVGSSRTSERP